MKVHRSVLISSIVVFVTRFYGISGETTAAAASPKLEESSKSPNLSSFETSSENGVSVRSKFSIEKSLNSSDKGMDENNLVKKSGKNSTVNVDVESRGLFNDKQDLKFNKNGKRLMSSVSGDLSNVGSSTKKINNEASEKDVRKQSSKSVGIDKDKKNFDGKKISTEIDNERRKHDWGKMQGSFVRPTLDGRDKNSVDILKRTGKPRTLNSPNLMTSLRSMFEIDEDNSDFKGIEKKMKSMMSKLKSLSKEHRETLIPYFDRFLSGILEKLESRDDEDIEQVEDLLERCTANRCCNNCCSCEKQRRNKKIKVVPQMVSNTRRKALRYDDDDGDASLEKAKKEIKISSMSSPAPTTSTRRKTTSLKATKTTIEITTKSPKKTTMTMTTEIPEPYKKMRFETLEKLRNRRRKRPVVSRRRLEDNNVGRKKLCVRRKSVGEQHRKSDPERGSRPNRRSNFDQDTSDTENIVRKKLRPNHRSNFDEDSSDSEMMPRKKLRSNHNFDDDTSDSEMIARKKLRPKHRSNFDQDTDDSVIVTRRKSNFNRGSPNSLEDIQSIL